MTSVLVVDGDSSARVAIRSLLDIEGFEVVVIDDGRSAIKAFQSALFNVVIIDVLIPTVDGLATVRAIHECSAAVPIIAIAPGKFRDCLGAGQDFLGVAATLGAAYCLYKPFMPRDLITAIIACLERKSPVLQTPFGRLPSGGVE